MVILGRTTSNTYASVTANEKVVTRVTVGASNFTFRRGTAKVNSGGPPGKVKMVVYAADGSGGAPGTLIAQSVEHVVGDGGYVDVWFAFSSPVTLTAGTNYYIGIHTELSCPYKIQNGTGLSYRLADTYSDGPSDPWGTATSYTFELTAFLVQDNPEVDVAKTLALAVLGPPAASVSVAKVHALAVLGTAPTLSVAKVHALAVLEEAVPGAGSRPQIMVCT